MQEQRPLDAQLSGVFRKALQTRDRGIITEGRLRLGHWKTRSDTETKRREDSPQRFFPCSRD